MAVQSVRCSLSTCSEPDPRGTELSWSTQPDSQTVEEETERSKRQPWVSRAQKSKDTVTIPCILAVAPFELLAAVFSKKSLNTFPLATVINYI